MHLMIVPLRVDFDLSNIIYCELTDTIPAPLLDRMEVIDYRDIPRMKTWMAKKYLVPKQFKMNGLKSNELTISVKTIKDIISSYTREAGVRS